MFIVIWNVQGLRGKLEHVMNKMQQMIMDITALR